MSGCSFDLDQPCGSTFTYRDFLECSDAWRDHEVPNVPKEKATFEAFALLCRNVLDPVSREFGKPVLTYGFCSSILARKITKGIAPKLDQHAGYELNQRGARICQRDGFAADFYIKDMSSLLLGQWIVSRTAFDRLYYYGSDRPLHVSASEEPAKKVVLLSTVRGKRMPRTIALDEYLSLEE